MDKAGGEAAVRRIAAAGGKALFLDQDVTEEARWPQVMAAAQERFGRLDILVDNAGLGLMGPWSRCAADWRRQQTITSRAYSSRSSTRSPRCGGPEAARSSWCPRWQGCSARPASPRTTRARAACACWPRQRRCIRPSDNIRVNSVHPGSSARRSGANTPGTEAERRNAPIDPHERARLAVPLGVAGQAQDIADGVLFLASDAARYMTGSELVIHGGLMAGGGARRSGKGARHRFFRSPFFFRIGRGSG